jgi:hypothetical protein
LDKKTLSEADICEKFITPAIQQAGWNTVEQIYREYTLRPNAPDRHAAQWTPLGVVKRAKVDTLVTQSCNRSHCWLGFGWRAK